MLKKAVKLEVQVLASNDMFPQDVEDAVREALEDSGLFLAEQVYLIEVVEGLSGNGESLLEPN